MKIKRVTIVYEDDEGISITKDLEAKEYHICEERGLCRDFTGSTDGSPVSINGNGTHRFTIRGWTGPETGSLHTEKS